MKCFNPLACFFCRFNPSYTPNLLKNEYSGFNQTIATSIDPHLSSTALNHAYGIIRNLPLTIKEQIQLFDVDKKAQIPDKRVVDAGLTTEQTTLKVLSTHPSILETPAGEPRLKNYLRHMRSKEGLALAFEPLTKEAQQVRLSSKLKLHGFKFLPCLCACVP